MTTAKTPRNVISVRFSDDELHRMKSRSKRSGVPVSTLIRQAALQSSTTPGASISRNTGAMLGMNAVMQNGTVQVNQFGSSKSMV